MTQPYRKLEGRKMLKLSFIVEEQLAMRLKTFAMQRRVSMHTVVEELIEEGVPDLAIVARDDYQGLKVADVGPEQEQEAA